MVHGVYVLRALEPRSGQRNSSAAAINGQSPIASRSGGDAFTLSSGPGSTPPSTTSGQGPSRSWTDLLSAALSAFGYGGGSSANTAANSGAAPAGGTAVDGASAAPSVAPSSGSAMPLSGGTNFGGASGGPRIIPASFGPSNMERLTRGMNGARISPSLPREALGGSGMGSLFNSGSGRTPDGAASGQKPNAASAAAPSGINSAGFSKDWSDKLGNIAPHERQAFMDKTRAVAGRLGMNPDHLAGVMQVESKMSPSVKNPLPKQTATGLIQFTEKTAKGLGTSTADLKKMSAVDQLDYVEKYLSPYKGKMNNAGNAYAAVFNPSALKKKEGASIYRKGQNAYRLNKGLDLNRDGRITKAELGSKVQRAVNSQPTASSILTAGQGTVSGSSTSGATSTGSVGSSTSGAAIAGSASGGQAAPVSSPPAVSGSAPASSGSSGSTQMASRK